MIPSLACPVHCASTNATMYLNSYSWEPSKLNKSSVLDHRTWNELIERTIELQLKPFGSELLMTRLIGQYLPVLISTKNTEAKEKAWGALWSYLTSPMTQSKPFTVSNELASQFIEEAMHILKLYGY